MVIMMMMAAVVAEMMMMMMIWGKLLHFSEAQPFICSCDSEMIQVISSILQDETLSGYLKCPRQQRLVYPGAQSLIY